MKNTFMICAAAALILFSHFSSAASADRGFTENKGQVGDQHSRPRTDILYSFSSRQFDAYFSRTGFSYQLSRLSDVQKAGHWAKSASVDFHRMDAHWINSSARAEITATDALPGFSNYYNAVCPGGAVHVKTYHSITYRNLYENIDLTWYERNSELKYDYIVKAGADYRQIRWQLEGAVSMSLDNKGQLIIETPLGRIIEETPLVLQQGRRLPAAWKLDGNTLSFDIRNVNASYDLIIDPLVRLWGSYYGGTQGEHPGYSCTDAGGNVYFSGDTWSTSNIATSGGWQNTYGGGIISPGTPGDAILIKMNSAGVRQWATYYGGTGFEFGNRCRVDQSGNIYLVGGTTSTNTGVIATNDGFQSTMSSTNITQEGDGFLVKFNSAGVRLWGTYYGDLNDDWTIGLSIDKTGNVVVSGTSWSAPGVPYTLGTAGVQQVSHSAGAYNGDAFLAKFSPGGARIWSTYYGATGEDTGADCATDSLNNIYLVGCTNSTNSAVMSTPGMIQVNMGGSGDGYFAKFDGNGLRLWSSYYGESLNDRIEACDVDAGNCLLLYGTTTNVFGTLFGTAGAHQPNFGGGNSDAFLSRFNSAGQRKWSTYYGGGGFDETGIGCTTKNGVIFICGRTTFGSANAVVTCGALQSNFGGSNDAYIARFDTSGARKWGSYFGGPGDESTWFASSCDASNNLYLMGMVSSGTGSTIIASVNGHQTTYGGGSSDIFLEKFDPCFAAPPLVPSVPPACVGNSAVLATSYTCGLKWYNSPALTNLVYSGGTFTTGVLSGDTTFYVIESSCGYDSAPAVISLTAAASPTVQASPLVTTICNGNSVTLSASGASSYTWTGNLQQNQVVVSPTVSTNYVVTGSGQNGCKSTATVQVSVDQCLGIKASQQVNQRIFPNPAHDQFTIELTEPSDFTLYSANGSQVLHQENLRGAQTIDTSSLPAGLYIGVIQSGQKASYHKIVIQD